MWEIRISHDGLHKYRVIKGQTQDDAQQRAAAQRRLWDEMWTHSQQVRAKRAAAERAAFGKVRLQSLAAAQTAEAERNIAALETILRDGVARQATIDFDKLKRKLAYDKAPPARPSLDNVPEQPILPQLSTTLSFWQRIIPPLRNKKIAAAEQERRSRHQAAYGEWQTKKAEIERINADLIDIYQKDVDTFKAEEQACVEQARAFNEDIDRKRDDYLSHNRDVVIEYCEMVLDASKYPESFPSSFEFEFVPETRVLAVDFALPSLEALPSAKSYKYVAAKDVVRCSGGEVKITQASRDGGVDAVAFDDDPIRGGKIIIQAKRYTNTVSVSAVRDLYGTILNEGAMKGILVTTADYGPDAYEFASNKPITLLSGSELLYLLQKHGHRARINLTEARMIAAERERARLVSR